MKAPNKKQQVPLGIAAIWLGFIALQSLQIGSMEGNSIAAELLRRLTTPGSILVFAVSVGWFIAVKSKKSDSD